MSFVGLCFTAKYAVIAFTLTLAGLLNPFLLNPPKCLARRVAVYCSLERLEFVFPGIFRQCANLTVRIWLCGFSCSAKSIRLGIFYGVAIL